MNEARKLDPELAEGLKPAAEAPTQDAEADLSPLILEQNVSLTPAPLASETSTSISQTATVTERTPFLDRFSNGLMVLFLSGVFSFLIGTAAAAAVVLGLLDLETGWVKDLLKTLKELAKTLSNGSGLGTPEP